MDPTPLGHDAWWGELAPWGLLWLVALAAVVHAVRARSPFGVGATLALGACVLLPLQAVRAFRARRAPRRRGRGVYR